MGVSAQMPNVRGRYLNADSKLAPTHPGNGSMNLGSLRGTTSATDPMDEHEHSPPDVVIESDTAPRDRQGQRDEIIPGRPSGR